MENVDQGLSALLSVASLLVLLLCGCSGDEPLEFATQETGVASLPRSFKGYELYSWKSGATWQFTLITGTNRLKTLAEITSPKDIEEGDWVKITVAGVPALKSLLARLPPGTQVFWDGAHPTEPGAIQSQVRLRLPPRRLIRQIQKHGAGLGLRLEMGD
jgi:hypothetical protein